MTEFNYGRSQATADRLITRFGKPAILRRAMFTGPDYAPVEGLPLDRPCTMVVEKFSLREIDGTRVLATDKKVLLAAGGLEVEPTTSDELFIDGHRHDIIDCAPEAPGGVVVYWTLQVRV